jgi:hypothetical protein
MKEVKVKLTLDDDDAKKGVEDLTKETKKLDKEVGDVNESTNTLTDSLDKMTGGAITGFKGMVKGVKSVILGFRTLKGAIAASGIGLLIIAIGAVTAAFTSTEEGQNKFAKLMSMISAVTAVFIDRLASLGTLLIDVFTKPQKVFKDFRDSIKEYVTDQITLVTDGLGLLGSAIKKAFSGDFSGALDDAGAGLKKLYIETNPLVQATRALAGATKDLVTEMTEEARMAGIIANQRAAADKLDRALIVDRAIANRERAKLLEQAIDKEKFSTEERIEFLKEAGRIEDEITQKEITAAKLRLEAKIAENALGGSTKEDLDEEAQLRANLINLETAKLTKAKEVTSQILALNAEAKAAEDAIDAEKKAKDEQAILDEEARIKRESDNYDARLAGIRERNAKELAEKQAFEESKRAIEDATINHTKAGIGILSSLAGENKALQATALIADNAVGIAQTIMAASRSIAERKAAYNAIPAFIGTFPNPAKIADVPLLIKDIASTKLAAGIGVATSGIALAKGLAALGKGGAGGGTPQLGGGAEGGAEAPAFNLVEGSESNAIQQSIQGQENAVKAFVVSGDVTTAQSADRRIVEGSGF